MESRMAPKTEILAQETEVEAREKRHDSKPHELICVWRTQSFAIHQAHAKTGATWLIAHFRTLRRGRKETKCPFIPTKRRGNKSLYGSPHGGFLCSTTAATSGQLMLIGVESRTSLILRPKRPQGQQMFTISRSQALFSAS